MHWTDPLLERTVYALRANDVQRVIDLSAEYSDRLVADFHGDEPMPRAQRDAMEFDLGLLNAEVARQIGAVA